MEQIKISYTIMGFLKHAYIYSAENRYLCIGKLYIFILLYPDRRYKQYKVIKNN